MINDIKQIINLSFEEVVASSLSLKLLDCYSKLYLCGGQPKTCARSQRQYYCQLIKNGIEMAQKFEEAKNRTCRPNWGTPQKPGIKYIPDTGRHWNSELLTDKEAQMLLDKGYVKSTDFEILPAKPEPVPEEKIQEQFEKRHIPKAPRKTKKK